MSKTLRRLPTKAAVDSVKAMAERNRGRFRRSESLRYVPAVSSFTKALLRDWRNYSSPEDVLELGVKEIAGVFNVEADEVASSMLLQFSLNDTAPARAISDILAKKFPGAKKPEDRDVRKSHHWAGY